MATRPFLLPAAVSGRHRPGRKTPCGAYVMSHALAARTGCQARNPVRLEYTIGAATWVTVMPVPGRDNPRHDLADLAGGHLGGVVGRAGGSHQASGDRGRPPCPDRPGDR